MQQQAAKFDHVLDLYEIKHCHLDKALPIYDTLWLGDLGVFLGIGVSKATEAFHATGRTFKKRATPSKGREMAALRGGPVTESLRNAARLHCEKACRCLAEAESVLSGSVHLDYSFNPSIT